MGCTLNLFNYVTVHSPIVTRKTVITKDENSAAARTGWDGLLYNLLKAGRHRHTHTHTHSSARAHTHTSFYLFEMCRMVGCRSSFLVRVLHSGVVRRSCRSSRRGFRRNWTSPEGGYFCWCFRSGSCSSYLVLPSSSPVWPTRPNDLCCPASYDKGIKHLLINSTLPRPLYNVAHSCMGAEIFQWIPQWVY